MSETIPSELVATVPAQTGGNPSSPGAWVGPVLGGSVLSVLSAGGTFLLEKRQPTPKSLARDFILGAVLILMISQLLPESTNTLLMSVLALFTSFHAASGGGGSPSEPTQSASEPVSQTVGLDEMEVKVGVPRF